MQPSLRGFMAGIIDYAGLFPPAKLPLDPAIRNYARYRAEPDAWMLGRFICPTSRLAELRAYHEELFRHGGPFLFSALGQGGESAAEFLAGLEANLNAIAEFRQTHGDRVLVEVLETRIPAGVAQSGDPDSVTGLLGECADRIERGGPPRLTPFYETQLGADWRTTISSTVQSIAVLNQQRPAGGRCGQAGFKLRCGGVEAAAFPSTEQVAHAIVACRDAGVGLKATAGLHHPVRRFDASVQTRMHGFLNVFGAALFAHAHDLDAHAVREILEDESPASFRFTADAFSWRDRAVGRERIESLRRESVTTFGSCSFDEPREDLKGMALLP